MTQPICHVNLAKGYRGGERQTELLIRGLAQHMPEQRMITRHGSELHERCADIPGLIRVSTANNPVNAFLKTQSVALIHAHEARAGQVGYLRWLKSRTPYVITRRVDNPVKGSVFAQAMLKQASATVGLTTAIGRLLKDYEPQINLRIIPSAATNLPVDATEVARLKERYQGKFIVGNVGALDHSHKGQGTLIEVARRVVDTHPDMLFLFLGDGKDAHRFREQSADLGNVEFAGFVNNVGDYLSVFNVFAFPSLHEGLGSILLDAMQFGIPIVATRVGGIPDVIKDDINGLLVPPEKPEALQQAILTLYQNPGLRERLEQNSHRMVDEYHVDKMVLRYRNLYNDILT